jgi:hypothetical protein
MIVCFVDIAGIVDLHLKLFLSYTAPRWWDMVMVSSVCNTVIVTPLNPYDGICSNWVGLLICDVLCHYFNSTKFLGVMGILTILNIVRIDIQCGYHLTGHLAVDIESFNPKTARLFIELQRTADVIFWVLAIRF